MKLKKLTDLGVTVGDDVEFICPTTGKAYPHKVATISHGRYVSEAGKTLCDERPQWRMAVLNFEPKQHAIGYDLSAAEMVDAGPTRYERLAAKLERQIAKGSPKAYATVAKMIELRRMRETVVPVSLSATMSELASRTQSIEEAIKSSYSSIYRDDANEL